MTTKELRKANAAIIATAQQLLQRDGGLLATQDAERMQLWLLMQILVTLTHELKE